MKILITGATGYIGHKLALEAVRKNYTVHILVRDPLSTRIPRHPKIISFRGDISDKSSIEKAIKGCDFVMHAAALAKLSVKDRKTIYAVNVEGTRNMLEASFENNIKRFVFTSSCAVIGPSGKHPMTEEDPRIISFENEYEISKHWAEELVKEYHHRGLFTVIAATSRVYGPGQPSNGNTMSGMFKNILSTGLAFIPSFENVVANYAYIDDVVQGHFLAMENGCPGEKYILGGENISYESFFHTIRNASGRKIRFIRIPVSLLRTWTRLYRAYCRLLNKETHISPDVVNRLSKNRALSCDKAVTQLGYRITPFSEGIYKTISEINQPHYA